MRAPGHFLFKLEFGDLSFAVSRALQAGLGAHINQSSRERREAGGGDQLTVFVHRTAEEQNRRNRRTNEVHAAAAERAVVAKAGTRHLETFHPSK